MSCPAHGMPRAVTNGLPHTGAYVGFEHVCGSNTRRKTVRVNEAVCSVSGIDYFVAARSDLRGNYAACQYSYLYCGGKH